MRALKTQDWLRNSLGNMLAFLVDNLMAIGAFTTIGFATLVAHKSVERLRMLGVPSTFIRGMEVLDICIWSIDAVTVLWLFGVTALRFCKKVAGG